jgi:hypothetical protein
LGSSLLVGCGSDGDPPDTSHVKVFLTMQAFRPNFNAVAATGLDSADFKCSEAAHNQGSSGTWTAWLSDNGGSPDPADDLNAVDRIFDSGGKPYKTIDGTIIANNLADLTDGTLDAPIIIDEAGNEVNDSFGTEVWSATDANGKYSGQGTCARWTDVATLNQTAAIGVGGATDEKWTKEGGGNSCDQGYNRLYCFADFISE